MFTLPYYLFNVLTRETMCSVFNSGEIFFIESVILMRQSLSLNINLVSLCVSMSLC